MAELTTVERVRGSVARSLKNLPEGAKARLAGGPPVVLDGQTLDRDIQVMLAVQEKLGETPMESLPVDRARDLLRARVLRHRAAGRSRSTTSRS